MNKTPFPTMKGEYGLCSTTAYSASLFKKNKTVQSHLPVAGSPGQPGSNCDCFVFLTVVFFVFFFAETQKKDRQGSEKPTMR